MFKALPSATVMPFDAVSVVPSVRIRFAVPVTVMRVEIVTPPAGTTYQFPLPHAVVSFASVVGFAAVLAVNATELLLQEPS